MAQTAPSANGQSGREPGGHPALLVALLILGLAAALYCAASLVIPVVVAIYLSLVFRPVVRVAQQRLRIPAGVTAALIVLGLVGAIVAAIVAFAAPATDWLTRMPEFVRDMEERLWPVRETITQAQEATQQIEEATAVTAPSGAASPVAVQQEPSLLRQALDATWSLLAQIAIIIVLTFFLLAEGSTMVTRWVLRFGSYSHATLWIRCIDQIEQQIGTYLYTLVSINAVVGVIIAGVCWAAGLPTPLLWGAVAGVLGLVPYLGPLVTLGMLLIAGFISFDVWWQALIPAGAYAVVNFLEGEVFTPMVTGRTLSLSPALIFLAILFWTWLWGPIGALLAVPILLAGRIVLDAALPQENGANEAARATSIAAARAN